MAYVEAMACSLAQHGQLSELGEGRGRTKPKGIDKFFLTLKKNYQGVIDKKW